MHRPDVALIDSSMLALLDHMRDPNPAVVTAVVDTLRVLPQDIGRLAPAFSAVTCAWCRCQNGRTQVS